MSTTADKLNYLSETKAAIKQAIVGKGVTVDDSTTFREYADKIGSIEGGGSGGDPIFTSVDDPSSIILNLDGSSDNPLLKLFKEVDLSSVNTKNKYPVSIFKGASNLEKVTLPDNLINSNTLTLNSLFEGCINLSEIVWGSILDNLDKISGFNKVFYNCQKLTDPKINLWKVKSSSTSSDLSYMFYQCYNLQALDLSSWQFEQVSNVNYFLYGCRSVSEVKIPIIKVIKNSLDSAFNGCVNIISLDLKPWNLTTIDSVVLSMTNMFYNCSSLTTLDLSSFNTSKVISMNKMFDRCSKLTSVTWGNNWASNSTITSFSISYSPLSHESCLDLFNKLATRDNNPTLQLSTTTKGYMSEEEIAIATNKGWTVA